MKKYLVILNMLALILIPNMVFAEEVEDFVELSKDIKYYKTTYYYDDNLSTYGIEPISRPSSYTVEVTEDEYYNHGEISGPQSTATYETAYKRIITALFSNGSIYRYRVTLDWQQIPKTRSYDIIGIGHYSDVKVSGSLHFSQQYCLADGGCTTTTTYTGTKGPNGASATFKLPSGTLTALIQSLYFDVEKSSGTVTSQAAFGDYSHATKSITKTNALKHTVDTSGINLKNDVVSYYDEISPAVATWYGTW